MLFCRHTGIVSVFGKTRHRRLSHHGNVTLCNSIWKIGHLGSGVGTYGEHLGYGVENERAGASMAATRSRTRNWFWMDRDARDSLPDEAGITLRPQAPIRSLMIRSESGSFCRPVT